MTIIHYF